MNKKYSDVKLLMNHSNDKMVEIIKAKIAESENAAVALVFDDKLLVLDEERDEFYAVNYKIEDRALKLSDWDKINLIADNDTKLESIANDYFDPLKESNATVRDMVEAFELKYSDQPVKQLINNTHSSKKSISESTPKIKALKEVRKVSNKFKDEVSELFKDDKIKSMFMTISESDSIQGTISRIDFKRPLSVALFEEISNKVINMTTKKADKQRTGNIVKKVNNLFKSEQFKTDFGALIKDVSESEDVKSSLIKFINEHKEILLISESELEDLIVKTTIMIGEAINVDTMVNVFKEFVELDEVSKMRDEYIERNNINESEDNPFDEMDKEDDKKEDDTDDSKEDDKKDDKKDKESTIDEDSINKIIKVLNKIKEPLKEKTLEIKFISTFLKVLDDAKVGSIPEGKLKEILEFLSSIYEQAKNEKEEE